MTVIEVLPNFETLRWTLCVNGVEVGQHKASLECDVWAAQLAKIYEEPVTVLKHREDRWALLEQLENARKEKSKASKTVGASGQG